MIGAKKPRQFEDPAIDSLLGVVLSLGNEVYVMRDRMRVIEKLLESKGTISRADIEAYKPTPEEEEELRKDNDAFMARLFRVFEGLKAVKDSIDKYVHLRSNPTHEVK